MRSRNFPPRPPCAPLGGWVAHKRARNFKRLAANCCRAMLRLTPRDHAFVFERAIVRRGTPLRHFGRAPSGAIPVCVNTRELRDRLPLVRASNLCHRPLPFFLLLLYAGRVRRFLEAAPGLKYKAALSVGAPLQPICWSKTSNIRVIQCHCLGAAVYRRELRSNFVQAHRRLLGHRATEHALVHLCRDL
jgi:hypothetical protein